MSATLGNKEKVRAAVILTAATAGYAGFEAWTLPWLSVRVCPNLHRNLPGTFNDRG